MKKKAIIAGLTCVLLLITGICYSCAYRNSVSPVLLSSVAKESNIEEVKITSEVAIDISPVAQESLEHTSSAEISDNSPSSQEEVYIYAHICGAVTKPGVYRAANGARLYEFVALAGGLTKTAAGEYMNQAQLVTDGQRIYIPDQKEIEDLSIQELMTGIQSSPEDNSSSSSSENTGVQSALININTATAEELMSISGIGQAKANSILAYREKNGKFNTIEELMNIPGIKEGLFQQISYMIVAN